MKNIAVLVNTLKSGGTEKQSILLLNSLNKSSFIFYFIFYGNRMDDKMLNMINGDNFKIVKLRGIFFYKIITFYKIIHSKNITHLFTFLTMPNVIGSIIGKITKTNYIYGSIRNAKLPKWKFVLEKFIANNISTKTIFNNYCGEKLFKEKGLKNSIVIPNGFDFTDCIFKEKNNSIKKIITVGTFVQQKDYKTALRSIADLKEYSNKFLFQIIGYGKLEHNIRHWISANGLNKYVQIIINPNNIYELLIEADIYLSTSSWEGTSNSIMEAMDAYLPIVATNVGDNDRLVFEKRNGFLNKVGDFNGITKNLKILLDDKNLRIKYGIESNKILRSNYSMDKFEKSYKELIYKQK